MSCDSQRSSTIYELSENCNVFDSIGLRKVTNGYVAIIPVDNKITSIVIKYNKSTSRSSIVHLTDIKISSGIVSVRSIKNNPVIVGSNLHIYLHSSSDVLIQIM
jgi:hypothetical protein